MLLFVRTREDYLKYALILCAATAGNYVLNAVHAGRYVRFRKYRLDLSRHMKAVLILLGSTIATEIYTMLDTVMLEYFYGKSYVGYYSNSVKIIRLVYTVSISLVATFYPRISYYIKQMDYRRCEDLLAKGFKTVILLTLPAPAALRRSHRLGGGGADRHDHSGHQRAEDLPHQDRPPLLGESYHFPARNDGGCFAGQELPSAQRHPLAGFRNCRSCRGVRPSAGGDSE